MNCQHIIDGQWASLGEGMLRSTVHIPSGDEDAGAVVVVIHRLMVSKNVLLSDSTSLGYQEANLFAPFHRRYCSFGAESSSQESRGGGGGMG